MSQPVPPFTPPPLIVGAWQLSEGHHANGPAGAEALDEFLEVIAYGVTTFDCADIYTGVEELLGEVRRRTHQRMGSEVGRALRFHTKLVPDRSALAHVDRGYVERIVDRSLTRLGVERLDLVQLAWWDYEVPGVEQVAGWLDEQRRAGKIEHVGATNFDVPHLERIVAADVPLVAHQVQYSPLDRRPERGMTAWAEAQDVRLLCYGTLAGGFLTDAWLGRPDPAAGGLAAARALPNRSLTKYRLVIEELGGWDAFQSILDLLRRVADRHGATLAQVALKWVLDRAESASVIVGMSRPHRIRECQGALTLRTRAEDWMELEALLQELGALTGDCFGLEREADSPHARIMRYDLNRVE